VAGNAGKGGGLKMIFTPENCDKILKGEKTQTRRLVKPGERLTNYPDGRKVAVVGALPDVSRHIKWVVDQTYAVQPGRGKAGLGRFRLLDIRQEQVKEISESDAIAEGFGSAAEFFETFESINGKRALDKEVWVLTFERLAD
jgi:hypothetical protein